MCKELVMISLRLQKLEIQREREHEGGRDRQRNCVAIQDNRIIITGTCDLHTVGVFDNGKDGHVRYSVLVCHGFDNK